VSSSGLIIGLYPFKWFEYLVLPIGGLIIRLYLISGLIIELYPISGLIIGLYPISGLF
jgi:hypothetical protein